MQVRDNPAVLELGRKRGGKRPWPDDSTGDSPENGVSFRTIRLRDSITSEKDEA